MEELIQDVVSASKLPPRSRGTSIKPTVAQLASACYADGVLPDSLRELVALVTAPSHLDQASVAAIVRSLYPAETVGSDLVLQVVGCLGLGELKPSLAVQTALLRWLILVYHVLESQAVLGQAYSVLFNLLDVAAIRPHLSHLLALITRRKHVRPFRIQAVLELSRQTGGDPSLVGLLRVFKDYYPEIIVGDAVRGKASAFKHPDPQWRERLDEIQQAHAAKANDGTNRPLDGFRVTRRRIGQKKNALPTVHTSQATEKSITLEEVDSAASLVANLEKIEMPDQLVAMLADPLLQKLLLLRPDGNADARVGLWLEAVLEDIMSGAADENTVADILRLLRDYVVRTHNLPVVVLEFLAQFLKVWDGKDGRKSVLDIVSRCPLLKFEDLRNHIFQPLEAVILNGTVDSQLDILVFYRNLLLHWATIIRSHDKPVAHSRGAFCDLIAHVNKLSLTLIQTSPTVTTQSEILAFYEQVAVLITDTGLHHQVRIVTPPARLVYIILFGHSLASLSRLCSVLASYKVAFEIAMGLRPADSVAGPASLMTYERDYVNAFNGFLMDICNCLWRARAFSDADTNALGCLVNQAVVRQLGVYLESLEPGFKLSTMFGLSHSPVLCLQSILSVRDLEDKALAEDGDAISARHAGPVTQASLARLADNKGLRLTYKEYRINVLQALADRGFPGIAELMKNTMKILMTPRNN